MLDIIILLLLIVAFTLGFKDGFVRKLIGSVGFLLAIYMGIKLSAPAGKAVLSITGIEAEFARVVGGFVIFLLVIVITAVIKRIVHPFDKVNNLINRIIGGVVGIVQILVFLSAVFYLLSVFKVPSDQAKEKSYLYKPVAQTLPFIISTIQGVSPTVPAQLQSILKDSVSVKGKDSIVAQPEAKQEPQRSSKLRKKK
ncbi:MAG: CvpA family protein [Ignavibacteria bacterium]|nr:CvpA family protein [Ignavibacteria bacterium]